MNYSKKFQFKVLTFALLCLSAYLIGMNPDEKEYWKEATQVLINPQGTHLQRLPKELTKEVLAKIHYQELLENRLAPQLKEALDAYDEQALEKVLSQGANPNRVIKNTYPSGYQDLLPPLIYLYKKPNRYFKPLAQILLKYGADINAIDPVSGLTLLHKEWPGYNNTEFLLEFGANPNKKSFNGTTILDSIDSDGNNIREKDIYQLLRQWEAKTSKELEFEEIINKVKPITFLSRIPKDLIAELGKFYQNKNPQVIMLQESTNNCISGALTIPNSSELFENSGLLSTPWPHYPI